jgi:hypothetical protein
MASSNNDFNKGIRIVKDMPDLSNDPTIRRWAEFTKDFLRKHPHPEIIEIDGEFHYIPSDVNENSVSND